VTTPTPLLSFIVLSYNYENYIGTTIRSILDQTVSDLEVVVVDDASSDRSCEVVRSFGDPRIRLLANERNLGGAGSYNVAVAAARGEWLVNLDADDWILPEKCARQLEHVARDPSLDVVGTWISLVGADGLRHPEAEAIEPFVNGNHPLNRVDTWIGANHLCRSSTMVRRSAHLRVGLDDASMVRAPDYELWTRFLRAGCRFGVVPEKLTCYRLQPRGVTRGDPLGSMLEMAWAAMRNLVPAIEARSLWPSFRRVLEWLTTHPEFAALPARERERLLGMMFATPDLPGYDAFRAALRAPDATLEAHGRRALGLALNILGESSMEEYAKLRRDVAAFIEARDFWKAQADTWELRARELQDRLLENGAGRATAGNAQTEGESCTTPLPNPSWTPRRLGRAGARFLRFFRS
jgi:GT2 family glycosyltransferase